MSEIKASTSKLHWIQKSNRLQKAPPCWLLCEALIRLGCGDSPSSPASWIKEYEEEGERLTEREKAEFGLPLTAQPVGCLNVSLCEPRTQGEMGSVGERIEAGLLKIMFFESAWHSIVHDPPGLCKMSPPAVLNFIFSVLPLLWLRGFLNVCVAFANSIFLFWGICECKGERKGEKCTGKKAVHLWQLKLLLMAQKRALMLN